VEKGNEEIVHVAEWRQRFEKLALDSIVSLRLAPESNDKRLNQSYSTRRNRRLHLSGKAQRGICISDSELRETASVSAQTNSKCGVMRFDESALIRVAPGLGWRAGPL